MQRLCKFVFLAHAHGDCPLLVPELYMYVVIFDFRAKTENRKWPLVMDFFGPGCAIYICLHLTDCYLFRLDVSSATHVSYHHSLSNSFRTKQRSCRHQPRVDSISMFTDRMFKMYTLVIVIFCLINSSIPWIHTVQLIQDAARFVLSFFAVGSGMTRFLFWLNYEFHGIR